MLDGWLFTSLFYVILHDTEATGLVGTAVEEVDN